MQLGFGALVALDLDVVFHHGGGVPVEGGHERGRVLVEREAVRENSLLLLFLIPLVAYRNTGRIQRRLLISKIAQDDLPLPNTQQFSDKLFKAMLAFHQQIGRLLHSDTHLLDNIWIFHILHHNHQSIFYIKIALQF